MTPKDKAEQLVESMTFSCRECDNAKIAALIAADAIIHALPPFDYGLEFVAKIQYWLDVKTEILAL